MLGTWQIIYFIDYIFYKEANKVFDKYFFDLFTKSSMFIYLCHDLWIKLMASLLVFPFISYKYEANTIELILSFIVIGVMAEIISFINYLLFAYAFKLIFERNKNKFQNKDKLNFQD